MDSGKKIDSKENVSIKEQFAGRNQNGEKKDYEFRPLSELNLMDNFLFGEALDDPEMGEEFAAKILKIITGKVFEHLKVVIQKQMYGADTKYHGARLDVYIEDAPEGELATVYDVEPEKKNTESDIKAIPKRTRFYHAKLSSICLGCGQSYENLKNVLVIMITPFDPFGRNRMIYTIKNHCIEDPDMPYEDGATTIFLYTKGKKGIPSREMKEFLEYFENTVDENAVNPDLKRIGEMVRRIKKNAEIGVRYMQIMEDERYLINQGRALERENTRRAEEQTKAANKRIKAAEKLIREKDARIAELEAQLAAKG